MISTLSMCAHRCNSIDAPHIKVNVTKDNSSTYGDGGEGDELIYLDGHIDGKAFKFVVDTACGGFIIHSKFIGKIQLQSKLTNSDACLEFANGSTSDNVKTAKIRLTISDTENSTIRQTVKVVFSDLGQHDAIVGLPWMKKHVHYINFPESKIKFIDHNKSNSVYPMCNTLVRDRSLTARQPSIDAADAPTSCLKYQGFRNPRICSPRLDMEKSDRVSSNDVVERPLSPTGLSPERTQTKKRVRPDLLPTDGRDTPEAPPCSRTSLRNVEIDVLSTKVLRWQARRQIAAMRKPESHNKATNIALMTLKQVSKAMRNKRQRHTLFLATNVFRLHDEAEWNTHDPDKIDFEDTHRKENPIEDLIDNPLSMEERLCAKFAEMTPALAIKYKGMLDKHRKLIPNELPDVKDLQDQVKHDIKLSNDAKPKATPIYSCSKIELDEMKRQITELLKAGHIRHSVSPWAAPVLFVKKKGTEKLRMCIDFRHLNKQTIKDATPIARIDELRQRLVNAKKFTALDMMSGYNQIKIADESIPYTAFNCRYGHFEWLVMPFGLTNAPATFSRWINKILGDLLDRCVVAYLDDILIYSPTDEQHVRDVEEVLSCLDQAGAILNLEKSHFHKTKVEFLGHNVDSEGITPNTSYVDAISKWPKIQDKSDLATFCGMINYFKAWISDYTDIIQPLNELRKKTAAFIWTARCDDAVAALQDKLINAPVLVYFDDTKETILTTDASAYAIGGWLGQRDHGAPDKDIKPILYWSRKMKDAETRYGVHEHELLAIVEMLRVCRPYVEGRPFIARTDHEALKWLNEQSNLSRRQASWVEKLQSFDMKIEYLPGKYNPVADALSRRPDFYPNCPRCKAKISANASMLVPHPSRIDGGEHVKTISNFATTLRFDTPILDQIKAAYSLTEKMEIDRDTRKPIAQSKPNWRWIDGVAYFGKRVFVPQSIREQVMYTVHDIQSIHAGGKKTIDLLQRTYYWPSMGKDVRKWIGTCDECQRKLKNRRVGTLTPLDIPQHRFTSYAMDHADGPCLEEGYDKILVVIDRLRKYLILVPANSNDTAEDTARRFFDYVVRTQGIPHDIVVDRDPLWTSKFWTALSRQLNVQMNITTARHQNANGLAESSVKAVKKMITSMLNRPDTESWVATLPIIQLAYNNTPHTSTGYSPNELTFGSNLNTALDASPTGIATADELTSSIDATIIDARTRILKAQEEQARYYNVSRRRVTFKKGDNVLLTTDGLNIPTSPKYTHRFLGPFKVLEVKDNDNYKLDLPSTMRIYPTFHISKLHLYQAPEPESLQASLQRPKEIEVEGEEGQDAYYSIDRLIDHRFRKVPNGSVKEYYAKWTGYNVNEGTWEPAVKMLKDVPELVEKYEMRASMQPHRTTKKAPMRKRKRTY